MAPGKLNRPRPPAPHRAPFRSRSGRPIRQGHIVTWPRLRIERRSQAADHHLDGSFWLMVMILLSTDM